MFDSSLSIKRTFMPFFSIFLSALHDEPSIMKLILRILTVIISQLYTQTKKYNYILNNSIFINHTISRHISAIYRVRHNYDNQGLMERYKFNSLSAINLTRG